MKTKTSDIFDDFAFFEFFFIWNFSFFFSFAFFVFRMFLCFFFSFFLFFLFSFVASSFFFFLFQPSEQTPKPVKIVEQLVPFVKMTISFCENSILGSLDRRRELRKAHLRVGPLSCFSFLLFLFVHS